MIIIVGIGTILLVPSISVYLYTTLTTYVMYKTLAKDDVVKLPDWMLVDLLILKNVVDGKEFFDYVKLILKTSGTIVSDQTRRMAMVSILGN